MRKKSYILAFAMILQASLWGQPKIIAHRGASAEAPENTLSAFANAISMGVDAIEFDVHLSQDKVPIIIHDFTFGRTTDGGFLTLTTHLPYETIRQFDVGSWYSSQFAKEKIPTLDEVLRLNQGQVPLMVEIKKQNSPAKEIAEVVINCLNETPGNYVVGSFSPQIIEEVRNLAPQYPVIGILEEIEMLQPFRDMKVKRLAIWYALLSRELIQELHEEGIEVWTFTVDNPPLAQYLESIGIDGIISNNPRLLKSKL
jgi:glycerophosphoryl diester phosphodiesterase